MKAERESSVADPIFMCFEHNLNFKCTSLKQKEKIKRKNVYFPSIGNALILERVDSLDGRHSVAFDRCFETWYE